MVTKAHEEPQVDSESLDRSQGRVDALMALLPEDQRAAVTLIVFGGMSVREAAEHLSVGKSQVDRNYQKAKRSLADLLGEPVEGFSGITRFAEETVEALDEMTSSESPELGEWIDPDHHIEDNPRVSDGDWNEYRQALAAVKKGSLVATDADYRTVRRVERQLGLPSTFSPAWNGGRS
jgi:hypothetical protein